MIDFSQFLPVDRLSIIKHCPRVVAGNAKALHDEGLLVLGVNSKTLAHDIGTLFAYDTVTRRAVVTSLRPSTAGAVAYDEAYILQRAWAPEVLYCEHGTWKTGKLAGVGDTAGTWKVATNERTLITVDDDSVFLVEQAALWASTTVNRAYDEAKENTCKEPAE